MQDRPRPAPGRIRPILAGSILLGLSMLPFLWNCQPSPTGSREPTVDPREPTVDSGGPAAWWDTSFTVSGVAFPGDSIFDRAVVARGNNHRLGRFLAKCSSGKQVRIGFIGGSITEGAITTSVPARYSSRFCGFLRKTFPRADIVELNAGLGGTDSRFGCSRLREDLLDGRPDMVVIEFAVNDDVGDTVMSAAAIEGLIRGSLQDPDVPVLLFQTMNCNGDSVNQGIQARIARHYALPVISYRDACWPLVESGILPWTELSSDQVHPNDKGHLIGGYLLYGYLKGVAAAIAGRPDSPAAIPGFLASEMYRHAGIFASETALLEVRERQGWEAGLDDRRRYRFLSHAKGDRLVIRTRAKEATAMYRLSKDLDSKILVSLEGVALDTLTSHFPGDTGGEALVTRRLYVVLEDKERSLEFVNLSGGEFDLRYLLYAE